MRAYTAKTGDRPPSKPIYQDADLRKTMSARLRPFSGPFTIHVWGKPEGPPRERADAVERGYKIATHAGTGLGLAIMNAADKGILVRVIDVATPASVTNGNEKVDAFYFAVVKQFSPGVQNLGATVNKTIGSTGTLSQHHDWTEEDDGNSWKLDGFSSIYVSDGGNAIDVAHASRATMRDIWNVGLLRHAEFDIQNLIHWPLGSPYPLIWNPENGAHRYDVPPGGSNHADHVHADFIHSRPWGGSTPR